MTQSITDRIINLPCWRSEIQIEALSGGMTNLNFKVVDGDQSFVVRLGEDDPIHLISRSNEIASSQAAHAIGVSPELVYHQPGILVARFIEGQVYREADVRQALNLERIVKLLKQFHQQMPQIFDHVPVMFWVFQVLRHYQNIIADGNSAHHHRLAELRAIAVDLEKAVGPVEIVFGHNDLLAANFIDDGDRIWLIDFDYAGFNSPLFDLANLASNNDLDASQEALMLEHYFSSPLDARQNKSYHAMKCASLLRETLWSMVSELHSRVDLDFAEYTAKNLERFELTYAEYRQQRA